MILQALAGYYRRVAEDDDSGAAPEGFEKKEIPFIVVMDKGGKFKGLDDTREGDGKKKRARSFIVPKGAKKSVNIAANLLWGTPAYVFGRPKPDAKKDQRRLEQRAKEAQQSFISKIKEAFPAPANDEGVGAVQSFLEKGDFGAVFGDPLWQEIEEAGANITFRLEGDTELVCQREAVRTALDARHEGDPGGTQCLITGKMDSPARLHTAIKGVRGAQSSGANIVSFNLDAFNSYGKAQGFNAPVGTKAEHAYTTALNYLLAKDSRQKLQVGDATTVFWAEKPNKMEEWFSDFFGEPPKGTSIQDTEAIRALYSSPHKGAPPLLDEDMKFYVLGLSPNASRIAIRFWYQGTVSDVAKNIKQHFDDCKIVHGPKEPEYLSIFRLLVSTAIQGKADNIQPNLAGEVMKCILAGTPYPQTLLSSAVRRIRAEQSKKDQNGKLQQNVTYQRASLIKAILVRDSRYYKRNEKEVGMALDLDNTNIGYRLGRLFSALEKIQEEASPGINATIRDRFYGAASSTPVTAFPHLMKLKNHHLAKLENRGRAVNLERIVGEIMDGVTDFPSHLSLQDQGRFSVGYYHQRQDFYTKKTTDKKED